MGERFIGTEILPCFQKMHNPVSTFDSQEVNFVRMGLVFTSGLALNILPLAFAVRNSPPVIKPMNSLNLCRFLVLTIALSPYPLSAEEILEKRTLYLGKQGFVEWEEFENRSIDAEKLEVRFQSNPSSDEKTLRIWQRDVKYGWAVKLNGVKLGNLTTTETALESLFAIPPQTLNEGENTLLIEPPSKPDDIEVGPIILENSAPSAYLAGSTLQVKVTDTATQQPIPCRLTLTRKDGTLQPLSGSPSRDVATRVGVLYSRNGIATLTAPPGDYILYAGKGFEWSIAQAEVSLHTGGEETLELALSREVSTEGWIAADSHIHTLTYSGHGDSSIEERMLTIAGEGIELAIATDHNHHTDYAPIAASAGLEHSFTSVIGNEVTTKWGHFNAFPIDPDAPIPDFSERDWEKLLPGIRSITGAKVITLNHPRDSHYGFFPLGELQFNPETGKHRQHDALLQVDAMELITSGAMQSDIRQLYRDWFALLNYGNRISGVGSSDTHDVSRYILGQGRTYVAADDSDPSSLNLDEVWKSYQNGRLLVSMGLLTELVVDQQFRTGDLATGLEDNFQVEAIVRGPSWVQADQIELYANGILIREEAIEDDFQADKKAHFTWDISKPGNDVHLVAIATGPGITEPFWQIPRPYQPTSKKVVPRVIGSTNPIWIDADGDGEFQSARDYAQTLVKQYAADAAKLQEALKEFDSAVALQVEALVGALSK